MNVILLQNRAGFVKGQETEILDRIAKIWLRKGWAKSADSQEKVKEVEQVEEVVAVEEVQDVGEQETEVVETKPTAPIRKAVTK